MCMNASFFPAIFSLPILYVFHFPCFAFFCYFLYSFTKMKACTVCANSQASIFYGLLAILSQKLLNY